MNSNRERGRGPKTVRCDINTAPTQAPAPRSRVRAFYWLASLLLAAVLLYFSLRGVEWRRVADILLGARPELVAACLGLGSVSLFLRALRWRVLVTFQARVSARRAFWATAAGYFGNAFLPARAGELIRTFMMTAGTGISKTFVLTTALSERVADAIVLVAISAAVLLTMNTSAPGWLAHAARPFGIGALCASAALMLAPRLEAFWTRLLARVPLPPAAAARTRSILEHVLTGIRSFHSGPRIAAFSAYTVAIWLLDAVGAVLGGRALNLPVGFRAAFLLMAGLGLGSALPSTPGYVGIYQFVAVSVLLPFGVSRTDAIAYILFLQVLQTVLFSFWGLLAVAAYRQLKREPVAPPDPAPEDKLS